MSVDTDMPEGGCDCGYVRYRLQNTPLFVHCCHCRWCQRETGASYALNAMIESDKVERINGRVLMVDTPSNSGKGQQIARCPRCYVAVWSHYGGAGPLLSFVRVGTIFTASRQPWVVLPPGTPALEEYYDRGEYWPAASLERFKVLLPRIQDYRASLEQH